LRRRSERKTQSWMDWMDYMTGKQAGHVGAKANGTKKNTGAGETERKSTEKWTGDREASVKATNKSDTQDENMSSRHTPLSRARAKQKNKDHARRYVLIKQRILDL